MNDKVSVLLPVYNEPLRFFEKSLQSILNQSYSNLEIIVVVDDPENIKVRNFLKNIKDDRLRTLINEKNLGLPRSLNKAIKYAHGKYIARMDADDISNKNRIFSEIKYLKANNLDLVASNISYIDENDKKIKSSNYKIEKYTQIKKALRFYNCMPHPTWMGKSKVFKDLKYRSINACEDYDFLLRGINKNYKYGLLPQNLLNYRINLQSISHKNNAYQKFMNFYLSQSFLNNKQVTVENINNYSNSNEGKKILLEIKKCDSQDSQYKKILYLIKRSFVNKYARKILYFRVKTKLVKSRVIL